MLTVPTRRSPKVLRLLVATVLVVAGFVTPIAIASPAAAEPGEDGGPAQATLRETLANALRDYNDAKGRVDASVARQAQMTEQEKKTRERLAELEARAGVVASAAYMGRRMNMAVALLDSGSPEGLLHAATTVQYLVARDDRDIRELAETRRRLAEQQQWLANELKLQQDQLAIMDKKKKEAEDALRKSGGGQTVTGPPTGGKATANPAGRNSDGSFPSQGCSIKDPTGTGGCITQRMQNAYNEARKAGFTHYTKCWRSGGSGEHPKGRACDFSANASTFVNARASGADKTYGDNLAAWCVANASRLGVLYVIWYKRIWQPGIGWKGYGGDGTPAGDHYNHVHLSVQ
jgi:hypothetical protein